MKTAPKPNVEQQICIDNIDGKILALSGPGTGKSFTLVRRVKHMIDMGINPNKILCLTFSKPAVAELQHKFQDPQLNMTDIADDIGVYTYHGFCNKIIQDYPDEFCITNIKIINETIARIFIREVIHKLKPQFYADSFYYIKKLKEQIDDIKKNRLTKQQFYDNIKNNPDCEPALKSLQDQLAEKQSTGKTKTLQDKIKNKEKEINQLYELWDIYQEYQNKMLAKHYLDFNDMISMVLDKFDTSPAFLDKIASQYEYLNVDEYQDTNSVQNDIVFKLGHYLKSVFVVGDDDQIIFSFQGAHLNTMENFLNEFPETRVVCFKENQRSTQTILNTAYQIASQDKSRLEANSKYDKYNISKRLIAKNPNIIALDKPIQLRVYETINHENMSILDEIEHLINSKNCPVDKKTKQKKLSEIAILAKTNDELDEFATLFKNRNIPYELKNGQNIFEVLSVKYLLAYMQALSDPINYADPLLQLLLSGPFHINPHDFATIRNNVSKYKNSMDVLHDIDKYDWVDKDTIQKFQQTYDYLLQYSSNENIYNTVLEIGTKTGIIDYYCNSDINRTENISGLVKLLQEAKDYTSLYLDRTLPDFVSYLIEILESDSTVIYTDKPTLSANAVQLITYHASKGREFEYVYMPNLVTDKWESSSKSSKSSVPLSSINSETNDALKESDNIKLMYVGMTRAKHFLCLSYAKLKDETKKKLIKYISFLEPMFVEIKADTEVLNYKTLQHCDYDYKSEFNFMIDSYLAEKVFSITDINTYIDCPRQYLYKNILGIQGYDKSVDRLSFGSAVHKAYELAVNIAKETGVYPCENQVIDFFKSELDNLSVSNFDNRESLITEGSDIIKTSYNYVCQTEPRLLFATEYEFNVVLDGIKFKGFIDRIDKTQNGDFIIYDYKTGKPKSKKDLSPNGKSSGYYNQMAIYKYIFEKIKNQPVSETTFVFVEDTTKNVSLNISETEYTNTYNKIKQSIHNMHDYQFDPTPNKDVCKYCKVRDICKHGIL